MQPLSQWKNKIDFYLNTVVNKIILNSKNDTAIGIEYDNNKKVYISDNNNGEIIICCGAIDTPKLLLLSGIGPQDHLNYVGIKTLINNIGVGMHLLDHPEGVIIGK